MVAPQRVEEPMRRAVEPALERNSKRRHVHQQQLPVHRHPMNEVQLHHHRRDDRRAVIPPAPPSAASAPAGGEIALTILQHIAHSRSDIQRLHLLRQLRGLLILSHETRDRSSRSDGAENSEEAVRDVGGAENCGAESVYQVVRSQALDKSVDLKLAWLLTMELRQRQTPVEPPCRESILIITDCLTGLWEHAPRRERRGHPHRRQASSLVWEQQLLPYAPWLVHAARIFPQSQHGEDNEDGSDSKEWSSSIPSNVIRIFRAWLRSTKDPVFAGELVRSPGLMEYLRELLAKKRPAIIPESRSLVLGLIKDLAFRSSDGDNQMLHDSLLSELLASLLPRLESDSNPSREAAGTALAVLWKLSTVPSAARSMGGNDDCWMALRLVASVALGPDSMVMHQHAVSIIGCLVAALLSSSDGRAWNQSVYAKTLEAQCDWIVPQIYTVLRSDECSDPDLRRRCVRLLRCFASCPQGRSILMLRTAAAQVPATCEGKGKNEGAELLALMLRMLRCQGESVDVRSQACQTVSLLIPMLAHEGGSFGSQVAPCLESTLIQTIQDDRTPAKLVAPLCEALHASLVHNGGWTRSNYSSVFYERLLSVLQENLSQPALLDKMSSLVVRLTDSAHQPREVLHLLADLAALLLSAVGPAFESSRENGVTIVEHLIAGSNTDGDSCSNVHWKTLADNERLLSALVGFCLMSHTEGLRKDRAKRLILRLVPEL